MEKEIENLLVELTIRNALNKIDTALDIQIQILEDWFLTDKLYLCDLWLKDDRIFTLHNSIILNAFVVTRPWRNNLKNRNKFFQKAKEHFEKTNDKESLEIIERINHVRISN